MWKQTGWRSSKLQQEPAAKEKEIVIGRFADN
jgi:hypothetical protein